MKQLIEKTAELSVGRNLTVKQGGLEISFHLFWDSGDKPTIEIRGVCLSKRKLSALESWLVESLADFSNGKYEFRKAPFFHAYEYQIKKTIKDSDVYKKFSNEIEQVLEQYEQQTGKIPDTDHFHEDVYIPAKELQKNLLKPLEKAK